jgi:putative ABC transport system permease protein
MYLPLANILHHKLRSVLSSLGIGIAVCMLVTLSGLAEGTVGEIGDRWETVDAELIAFPRGLGDNIITLNGPVVSDRLSAKVAELPQVQRVVPVFLTPLRLGGQDQTVVGVDADQWHTLTGGRTISSGRLFDPGGAFSRWIEDRVLAPTTDTQVVDVDAELGPRGGLELVIDSRLAAVGKYSVGQTVRAAEHDWKIVGVVPAGAMARVFMPRRTAQYVFGLGGLGKSTLLFIKLKPGADARSAAAAVRQAAGGLEAVPVAHYRGMLQQKLAVMYRYIAAVNGISLAIAFLFIMVTLYMMVLQRTREIAILKSCGATRAFVLRQVLSESLILTSIGVGAGLAMTVAAAWAVAHFAPLYSVSITGHWVGVACVSAGVGAVLAAAFPAWRAMKVDMVEALAWE